MIPKVFFWCFWWGATALGGIRAGVAKINISPEESAAAGSHRALWAKALALEDDHGNRAVLISLDVASLPLDFAEWVAARIQPEYGLDRARLLLNSSDTCGGPLVSGANRLRLAGQIVTLVGSALGDLRPAQLDFAPGVAVLRVLDRGGKPRALVLGYAGGGEALETEFPGAIALAFAPCGGDRTPSSAEVARGVRTKMAPVSGQLRAVFQMIDLPLAPSARGLMRKVPFPVQVIRFEHGFTLIALGGEVAVDFALWARREFPRESLLVAGFSNGVADGMPGHSTPEIEERVKDAVRAAWKRVLR